MAAAVMALFFMPALVGAESSFLHYPAFIFHSINAPERLAPAKQRVKDAGFSTIFVWDSVDGKNSKELREQWTDLGINYEKFMSLGPPQAAIISHLLLLQFALNSNMEYFFFLEDDVFFHSNWSNLWEIYWEATPKDFHLLYIGSHMLNPSNKDLVVQTPCINTHAIMYSRVGVEYVYDLLLKTYQSYNGEQHVLVDQVLFEHEKSNPPMKWYAWNRMVSPDVDALSLFAYRKNEHGLAFQDITNFTSSRYWVESQEAHVVLQALQSNQRGTLEMCQVLEQEIIHAKKSAKGRVWYVIQIQWANCLIDVANASPTPKIYSKLYHRVVDIIQEIYTFFDEHEEIPFQWWMKSTMQTALNNMQLRSTPN